MINIGKIKYHISLIDLFVHEHLHLPLSNRLHVLLLLITIIYKGIDLNFPKSNHDDSAGIKLQLIYNYLFNCSQGGV